MHPEASNLIKEKTTQFSLSIIPLYQKLLSRNEYVISNQLLKSATSIGANVREAQNPESLRDFVHKMKIALKEAEETEYWLTIVINLENMSDSEILLNDVKSIIRILAKIISTSNTKLQNSKKNNN